MLGEFLKGLASVGGKVASAVGVGAGEALGAEAAVATKATKKAARVAARAAIAKKSGVPTRYRPDAATVQSVTAALTHNLQSLSSAPGQAAGYVLEDSGLTNAKALTKALQGNAGAPPAAPAAMQAKRARDFGNVRSQARADALAGGASKSEAAEVAERAMDQSRLDSINQRRASRGKSALSLPGAPGGVPPANRPLPAGASAGTPPSAPAASATTKRGFGGSVADTAREWAGRLKEELDVRRSVSEKTKGMSLQERYGRLEQLGRLIPPANITPAGPPTMEHQVGSSEAAEEYNRQQAVKQRARTSGAGGKALGAAASGVAGVIGMATAETGLGAVVAVASFTLAIKQAIQAMEMWSSGILEDSRDLRKFSGAINRTFAKLERQEMLLDVRQAGATSGSASALGDAIGGLRESMQPFREAGATLKNTFGIVLARLAQLATIAIRFNPVISPFLRVLALWEKWLGSGKSQAEYAKFIDDILKKGTGPGKVKPPLGGPWG